MDLNFLDVHHIRMKKIGAYALLFRNSINKDTWKKYYFNKGYEQDNLIFSVLLYIMEESLKEEVCTIDHITSFLDKVNEIYFNKPISYEECRELANFIINNILCNEGKAMYFKGYDFKNGEYKDINISFIKNKMEYIEGVRRVTYSLTDMGYDIIMSTFEIEENLKITIQEIIFKEHLRKASYDKAVNDIKNIFQSYRNKIQSMEEAIRKIKENPLAYSKDEYKKSMESNFSLIDSNKKKFVFHREKVDERINEFVEHDINIGELTSEESENLNSLRIIKGYLNRVIDEDQKILNKHFDLKSVYGSELENIARMSLIERFNFKREVFEKILEYPDKLENLDIFLTPLFKISPNKIYNINKALEYQKNIKKQGREEDEILSFNEEEFIEEENKKKLEKLDKYKKSISLILEITFEKGKISLSEINSLIKSSEIIMKTLIPSVEIFREVVIEFLKNKTIDIKELREENKEFIENGEVEFQFNKTILDVIEENYDFRNIEYIEAGKLEGNEDVNLEGVISENGLYKNFICSDVYFEIIKK